MSSDGTVLVLGSTINIGKDDKTASLWSVPDKKRLVTLRGHNDHVWAVALSRDGKYVVTGSRDTTARLWDAGTGKELLSYKNHHGGVRSVTFTSDGKNIITGGDDGLINIWGTRNNDLIRQFKGSKGIVTHVVVSPDDKRVVSCSTDGNTRIWDIATGKELCSLISIDAGKDWLVVTPEGFFDGSPAGMEFVSYRVPNTRTLLPLSQFEKKYYKEGLLAKIWKGEKIKADVAAKDALPPEIVFISPEQSGTILKDRSLTVKAVVVPRNEFPVREARLLIDGRPYLGASGVRRIANPKSGKVNVEWTVELEPRKEPYTLRILADTEYAQGVSEVYEIHVKGVFEALKPKMYIFAVGVAKYKEEKLNLHYAANDATTTVEALTKFGQEIFKIESRIITDQDATKDRILDGLAWLKESMTSNDYGVFIFSGHGDRDNDGTLYFLPHDANPKRLLTTGIDADQLKKNLTNTQGRLIAIFDACHSGGIDDGKRKSTRGLSDELMRNLISEQSGVAVLCSSSGNEFSLENNEHRHGNFTVALLEALAGKKVKSITLDEKGDWKKERELSPDLNGDGVINLQELDVYITERVKDLSRGQQHPRLGKPASLRGDLPISKPKS
jgi:hypothetical protein